MRPAQALLPDGISLEHLCVPRQVGRCYGRHACTGSCERNRPHAKGGGARRPRHAPRYARGPGKGSCGQAHRCLHKRNLSWRKTRATLLVATASLPLGPQAQALPAGHCSWSRQRHGPCGRVCRRECAGERASVPVSVGLSLTRLSVGRGRA